MKKSVLLAAALLGVVALVYFQTTGSTENRGANSTASELSTSQTSEQTVQRSPAEAPYPAGELVETIPAGLMLGNYYSENLDDLFYAHLDAALSGNAASQHEVHSVLKQCDVAVGMIGLSGGRESLDTAPQNELTDELKRLAEECVNISSSVPRFKTPAEWSEELLAEAADNGSKVAKLKVEWPAGEISEETYSVVATNLEEAVREGHYASYYFASDFIGGLCHSDGLDVNFIEMVKWRALGCQEHSACNLSAFYHNIESELTPTEVAIVKDFVSGFDERLKDPTPFGFANGWLPLYEYSTTANNDSRSGIASGR